MQDSYIILAAMLGAIRRDLELTLRPEISGARARAAAGMMSETLAYLTVWQRDLREHLPHVSTAQRAVLAKAVSLLEQAGVPNRESVRPAEDNGVLAMAGTGHDVERLQQELDQTIEALTSLATDASARLSADAIREVLAQSVDSELELLDQELRLVGLEQDESARPLPGTDVAVTEDALICFVRDGFPGDPGARIQDLDLVSDGFVKDTYSFTLKASTGRCRQLVLRRELPFGAGGIGVLDEFGLLKRLYQLGFPVPEPVYCETEAAPLGQPFILTAFVEGMTGTQSWEGEREVRRDICFALARILGRLHNLPPSQMPVIGAPLANTPQDHIRAYIGEWHDLWVRRRLHPSPTLTAAFHWLLENVPDEVERLSVLHADVGFSKILTRGGNIQALLDWDFAHLGDPVEELDRCREFIEPLASWPMFLEEYRAAGGVEYSEQNARFHAVWRGVRDAVSCSLAWHEFLNGDYPVLKMAYRGVPLYRRFVRDTARQLKRELQ